MTKEQKETEDGISHGTDQALGSLSTFYENGLGRSARIISIDMFTIARNLCAERDPCTMKDVAHELDRIIMRVGDLLQSYKSAASLHFFFIPYWDMILPYGTKRETSPYKEKEISFFREVYALQRERTTNPKKSTSFVKNSVTCNVDIVMDPRINIVNWYTEKMKAYHPVPSVVCMSSMPVVWQVAQNMPFAVLRAYSGGIMYPTDFSEAAFGEAWKDIPFTIQTHAAFGDTKLLASQFSISQKKEIRELAIAEKWNKRSVSYVDGKILEYKAKQQIGKLKGANERLKHK